MANHVLRDDVAQHLKLAKHRLQLGTTQKGSRGKASPKPAQTGSNAAQVGNQSTGPVSILKPSLLKSKKTTPALAGLQVPQLLAG